MNKDEVLASLRQFVAGKAALRGDYGMPSPPYHGRGLRPHNALWNLVIHCGLPFDEARALVEANGG